MPGGVWRAAAVLAAYLAIAAVYTHPLLERSRVAIGSDRFDPVLNASILWWNATTLPFSAGWWTPPHFYPSERIAAFTENLTGLGPVATPLYYATGDPLLTYNLTLFLTWPLSAFTLYLLAVALGVRAGPAFVGGLVFGFAPYRVAQMSHLQVLACFWLPLALAALHRYIQDRRAWWLALFGLAWLLQSLTNGYFMLFGGVLIGLWLVYFCSTRDTIRLLPRILAAWIVSSLLLLPVLLQYRGVHDAYGLRRPTGAIVAYSAQAGAWMRTSNLVSTWGTVLPDRGEETNLFPGVTAVLVVVVAALSALPRRRDRSAVAGSTRSRLRMFSGLVAFGASALVLYTVAAGPWRLAAAGVTLRVTSIDRPLLVAVLGWLLFALSSRRRGVPAARRPFLFYCLATLAMALLCMGPAIRSGTRVVLDPAPYGWLMALPGFEGLRVPTRFWMLGTIGLAMATALGLDRLAPVARWPRAVIVALVSLGVLADGWLGTMPMGQAPEAWTRVEPAGVGTPLIELPLGPEFDAAATFRAVGHRRRVVNGVSGYDPPHYAWLRSGLDARDPEVLLALTSFGPLDVVIDRAAEDGTTLDPYVAGIPGAERLADDGVRASYRLRSTAPASAGRGGPLPVRSARASRGVVDLQGALDGNDATTCRLPPPQASGEWVELDLGAVVSVGGVDYALGGDIGGYPRSLAIDVSADGSAWHTAWQDRGLRHVLAGLMRAPRSAVVPIRFDPRDARYVRLRLLEAASAPWMLAELTVLSPAGPNAAAR